MSPRYRLRAQHAVFLILVCLIIGLAAWQSQRFRVDLDWTGGARHSLSEASLVVVRELQGPVRVEAFARNDEVLRTRVRDLIGRYQRHHAEFSLEFVNPDLEPVRTRELGVTIDGELVVSYDGRIENLDRLDEQSMTNLLARLLRSEQRLIGFLTGHGERDARGQANHDFGEFGQQLQLKGFSTEPINLSAGDLLDEIDVLVVADPRVPLLPEEREILLGYVETGGNLLWFKEANSRVEMPELDAALAVQQLPGVIVDSDTRLFGIKDPTFALVPKYPESEVITKGLSAVSVFPRSAALSINSSDWRSQVFLKTRDGTWNETGALRGSVGFNADQGESRGPLNIGVALSRDQSGIGGGSQRIVVLGDADFLSNAYLGNGANLDLGLRMFNWLSRDDRLIAIAAKTAPDVALNLDGTEQIIVGFGFLLVLPLGLLLSGFLIWRRRQRGA